MFKKPDKVKQPGNYDHAYNYVLFLLGLSIRTEAEICRKMEVRGYDQTIIDQIIAVLLKEKLIDDAHYAEVYVRNLKEYRTFGYYGIKKKLMEKRIPSDIIEQALNQYVTMDEELVVAQKFITKQAGSDFDKTQLTQAQKQKFAQKLQSRGFRSDILSKILF